MLESRNSEFTRLQADHARYAVMLPGTRNVTRVTRGITRVTRVTRKFYASVQYAAQNMNRSPEFYNKVIPEFYYLCVTIHMTILQMLQHCRCAWLIKF
jgi:hypothetical protein